MNFQQSKSPQRITKPGPPLFKILLGQNLMLNEEGWRVLTWLWLAYFIFISVLNEFIWRNYSWEFWATFKAFGLMPMTIAYALPQMWLLKRYHPHEQSVTKLVNQVASSSMKIQEPVKVASTRSA